MGSDQESEASRIKPELYSCGRVEWKHLSGCSSVRLERTVRDREVGGSNPPTPTIQSLVGRSPGLLASGFHTGENAPARTSVSRRGAARAIEQSVSVTFR